MKTKTGPEKRWSGSNEGRSSRRAASAWIIDLDALEGVLYAVTEAGLCKDFGNGGDGGQVQTEGTCLTDMERGHHLLETGVTDWKWAKQYGGCVRIDGLFGVSLQRPISIILPSSPHHHSCQDERLFISDPRALQHICANAGTDFVKPLLRRSAGSMFLGMGIGYVQG